MTDRDYLQVILTSLEKGISRKEDSVTDYGKAVELGQKLIMSIYAQDIKQYLEKTSCNA